MIAAGTMDYPLIAYHFRKAGTEPETMIPILYAIAMATDGVAGFALGKVFDRVGVKLMAGVSLITASAVPLIFALRQDMAGAAIWGIGLGAQSSIMKAFIATIVPKERRGAAYGIFALAYGVAWFGGSVLMGVLYEHSITVLIAFAVASQLLAVPLFIVVDKRT
jgi:MFS family permease